jgi:hypothetical protein
MNLRGPLPVSVDREATAVKLEVHVPEQEATIYGDDAEEEEN